MERAFIDPVFSDELNHEFEIACRLTDEAIALFVNEIHAGMTELELNEVILGTIDRVTADCAPEDNAGKSFLILESGARTSLLHGRATDKVIEKGDFVTIDFGIRYRDAYADMTRTFVVGKATEEQRFIYETVLKAYCAARFSVHAGMTGVEADAVARKVIADAGYGPYFIHSLGHGLLPNSKHGADIEIWLAPEAGDYRMKKGELFTIEPGIYLPEKGGVRIEDTFIMEENGPRPLFTFTKELLELD